MCRGQKQAGGASDFFTRQGVRDLSQIGSRSQRPDRQRTCAHRFAYEGIEYVRGKGDCVVERCPFCGARLATPWED